MKKLLIIGSLLTLTACGSIPVKYETGRLDTNYEFGAKSVSNNRSVAIVDPTGSFENFAENIPEKNPMLLMMGNSQTAKKDIVASKYQSEVMRAFRSGIQTIITNRGFTFTGPYESFDEITYRDKKNSYLAIVPVFDIQLGKMNIRRETGTGYTEETGIVTVDGEFSIKVMEPMTKQVLMKKRIDLSRLKISEPYTIQVERDGSESSSLIIGAIGGAIKAAGKPEVLVNTYDKAYALAMTKFYQGSMEYINKYISAEELLDYELEVNELKGKKVY